MITWILYKGLIQQFFFLFITPSFLGAATVFAPLLTRTYNFRVEVKGPSNSLLSLIQQFCFNLKMFFGLTPQHKNASHAQAYASNC